jgi:serine protease Do
MNTNWKALILVGLLSSATTIAGYKMFGNDQDSQQVVINESSGSSLAKFTSVGGLAGTPGDFVYAAETSTPTVVHIKSTILRQQRQNYRQVPDFFREFFGEDFRQGPQQPRAQEASGSGVIISEDGYIVTNNHVVEGADELEVTLFNKSKVRAKIVGTDPSTDIAVIKVEEKDLPAIVFGNSEAVKVGEWVVAVGNPFNLESTVTAGIVSAKGRGLGIISQEYNRKYGNSNKRFEGDSPLEAFIQTDAVVNPGNSGGALVNLKGELIGINTAIASPTGSYAGYAFAVPTSIVKKVTTDIIKFGGVQRGYLGIQLDDLDSKKATDYGVKVNRGAYVAKIVENSAAGAAGVKEGDVIVKVNGNSVISVPHLQQMIGLHAPNDKVNITVNRDGKEKDITVTLRNRDGGSDIIKRDEKAATLASLGASFQNLTAEETQRLKRYKVEGGVKLTEVQGGKFARTGAEVGFIITKINGKAVKSVKELENALAGKEDTMVQFEGLYPDAPYDVYTFGFRI